MPEQSSIASQIKVFVDGTEIPRDVSALLTEVVVDQNAFLPGMFMISLKDQNMEFLDGSPFDLTKEAEIKAVDANGSELSLVKGEIVSLEPRFSSGMMVDLIVRGYDKSHRLYRESKSVAYLNKKDSDLANDFAGNAGLSPQVDATTTVYDVIYQDNQSDLAFLMQRAWRIGYECFVAEGKLYFRKPPTSGSSPSLTYGDDLQEFFPRISLAEQVDEVQVKSWDMKKKEAIVGKSTSGKLYAKTGEKKDGSKWAGAFGTGKKIIVDHPVISQAEADVVAQARLNEISGAFETAEGIAIRRPDIKAGGFVELKELGRRFSGKYMVTSATHIWSSEGLKTEFSVRGARAGLLFEQMTHQSPVAKWGGVVPAIVTNNDDPEKIGRVKVKYPWMSSDSESDWARVVSPGAGPEAGFCLIPNVDDEVIIAFEHGDINRPFVLGGVWNGQDALPPDNAGAGNGTMHQIRSWKSIGGHKITMFEDGSDKKIEITSSGGHNLVLDDQSKKIEMKTSGGHSLTCDDGGTKLEMVSSGGHKIVMDSSGITIESAMNLTITATANIKIEATGMMDLKANGPVNIKGAMVNIN